MKKYLLLFTIIFSVNTLLAQTKDPVTWTYEAKKKTATTYDLIATATLPNPWHIYSQNTEDGGPLPTKISFNKNPLVIKVGKVLENGKLEKTFDENFKVNVLYYSNKVSFIQSIKIKALAKTKISGMVEYMVCNDELCLPPTKKSFSINL